MASVSSCSLTQHVFSFPSAHCPQAASNASFSCPPAFRARSAYSLPKRRAQIHASRASVVGGSEKLGTRFRGSRSGLGSVSERSAELQHLRHGAESGSAENMITWNRELLFNVLLPLGGGLIASAFAAPNLKLYGDLKKPKWAPPAPLFGNVWSFIYLSIGYAAWLVYRDAGGFSAQPGLWKLYGAQLILNWLWQPLFFTKQFLGVAFIDLVLLWFTIIALIGKFSAINTLAGKALIPYLAWVTFAGALNWNLWQNNPAKDKDPQELKPKAA